MKKYTRSEAEALILRQIINGGSCQFYKGGLLLVDAHTLENHHLNADTVEDCEGLGGVDGLCPRAK